MKCDREEIEGDGKMSEGNEKMKVTGKTLWLICIVTFVIGMGIIYVLEDPYIKSLYYETDAWVTVELEWADGADSCKVYGKLVYNRPFAFIFPHKPSSRNWAWSTIHRPINRWTKEPVNSTILGHYHVKRPATLIVWTRYYKDIIETNDGIELETKVIVSTVRHEYLITPVSKSFEVIK